MAYIMDKQTRIMESFMKLAKRHGHIKTETVSDKLVKESRIRMAKAAIRRKKMERKLIKSGKKDGVILGRHTFNITPERAAEIEAEVLANIASR